MEQLNIPKTIHVGYNTRNDTYTGKLGYVIYTDEKGVKRKETSWNSWRSKDIPPDNYTNDPTSGFVLNKGVGGARQSWGWNARNEYIRVYDPRGFEFEISVSNLLFILQECTSIKGKGLEGEFVYSWEGTQLVLLPVGCYEYKKSTEFTAAKAMKVVKSDMVEGCTYMHKNMHQMVYIGKHKVRDDNSKSDYYGDFRKSLSTEPVKIVHVFYDLVDEKYVFERGFTNLAQRVSHDEYTTFADLYSDFVTGVHVDCLDAVELVELSQSTIESIKNTKSGHSSLFFIETSKDVFTLTWVHPQAQNTILRQYDNTNRMIFPNITRQTIENDITFNYAPQRHSNLYYSKGIDVAELSTTYNECKLYTIQYKLKLGKKVGVYGYVK